MPWYAVISGTLQAIPSPHGLPALVDVFSQSIFQTKEEQPRIIVHALALGLVHGEARFNSASGLNQIGDGRREGVERPLSRLIHFCKRWSSCSWLAEKTQRHPRLPPPGTTLSNLERPPQMKCLFEKSPGAILMGSRCRK